MTRRSGAADARLKPSRDIDSVAFAALLALLVAAAYANSLGIGFHFDDINGLAENPSIRSLRNIPSFFRDPFTLTLVRENVDVRPVLQTTYALNYAVSGLDPWSWHALNLVLHLAAALLVFVIVRDYLWPDGDAGHDAKATLVAGAAALFFALAPLNSQPLDYMWARSALLCTVFYLGAFYAWLRGRWTAMALLLTLALLTKAIAITLPGAAVLCAVLYRDRIRQPTVVSWLRAWRSWIGPIALMLAIDGAYLLFRGWMLPPWANQPGKEPFATPWIWLMSGWSAQLYYVRLFLWPDALSLDHEFPYAFSFFQTRAWLPLLVILAWLGLAFAAARRHRIVTFATLWFFLTLSIESTLSPLSEVVNDHRPYIATSLGLAVLLAWTLERAASRAGSRARTVFVAAAAAICAAAIPATIYRNWQWGDYDRIWEDAARKGPGNGRAWLNLATSHMGRGDLVVARRDLERAKAAAPAYAYVYINLSVLETTEGHLAQALADADEGVRLNPGLSLTHYYRGQVLERLTRVDEAAAEYRLALAADPRDRDAQSALDGLAHASYVQ